MIPQLYEKDTTSFPSSSTQMGGAGFLGGLPDCISCDVCEVLNGEYECTFQYPCNAPMYPEIKIGRIILVSHDALLSTEPFDIYAVSINIDGVATFQAHHVSYRLAKRVILPFYDSNVTTSKALNRIMQLIVDGNAWGTYSLHNSMNKLPGTTFTASYYGLSQSMPILWRDRPPATSRSLLLDGDDSILALTGCEFEWVRFNIRLHNRRGADKPAVIRFSHNLKAMTYDYDRSNYGTQIIPYVPGHYVKIDSSDTGDETWPTWYVLDGDSTDLDGGKLMPISGKGSIYNIPISFSGDYASFPSYYARNAEFYATPVDISSYLTENDGELPSPQNFIAAAKRYCKDNNIGKPYENLTIDFEPIWRTDEYKYVAATEKLVLGDSAIVLYPEVSLNKRMKVVSATWDALLERYKQMEFGTTAQGIYTVNLNTGAEQMGDEDATVIVDNLPDIDEIPIPEDE